MKSNNKFYQFNYSFAKKDDIVNGVSYQHHTHFDIAKAIKHVRATIANDETITVSIADEKEIGEDEYRIHVPSEE